MQTLSASTRSKRSELSPATYSLSEFAGLLGLSYTLCHQRAQAGTLPLEPLRIGRKYLFPKAKVHELLGIDDRADA